MLSKPFLLVKSFGAAKSDRSISQTICDFSLLEAVLVDDDCSTEGFGGTFSTSLSLSVDSVSVFLNESLLKDTSKIEESVLSVPRLSVGGNIEEEDSRLLMVDDSVSFSSADNSFT